MTMLNRVVHRGLNTQLARRDLIVRPDRAMVTFSFDDIPQTAATIGAALLQDAGFRGTFYVAMGLLGTETALGACATLEDVRRLHLAGHEIGCHTHDHVHAEETPPQVYERDARRNSAALESAFPGLQVRNFSYASGSVRVAHKRRLQARYRSMRGVQMGMLRGVVDRNQLPVHKLYAATADTESIDRLIAHNCETRGWLVLYTHDISDTPSPYGCTPALLRAAIGSCVRHGADVLTIDAALDRLSVV